MVALTEERQMTQVHILAIDLAKRSFQVCATDRGGAVLFNRVLSRTRLQQLLSEQSLCVVAMEACATSHFWGRFAQGCGHEVRLIPPIYVKPFVKRQKNDAADAAAVAEAALRPNMHYVAVKSAEHQARAVTFRTHQCFVRQRTQLINALRGHLGEFGIVVAQGPANLTAVVGILADQTNYLPDGVREIGQLYLDQIRLLTEKIDGLMLKLREATKANEDMRRLCTVPGVGPVTAGAILAFAPDLHAFKSGRNFAAWLGLVPRQHSTGGNPTGWCQQDGADRYPKATHRRSHEPDPLDRPQGRVTGQLAWSNSWAKASDGGSCRARQQDGAHHMGNDDQGAELQNGVIRCLSRR
jgi:transposase